MERRLTVTVHGRRVSTVVTRRAQVVREWLWSITGMKRYKFTRTLVVGLGVQWTPSPHRNPKVATLQLCVGSRCLIFQIGRATSVPKMLRDFLVNERNGLATFVGVRNYRDAELLEEGYGLDVERLLELGGVGGVGGNFSMESLARDFLGYGIRKEERIGRSNWEAEELSDEQIVYACVDAYVSFQLGKQFKAWKHQ